MAVKCSAVLERLQIEVRWHKKVLRIKSSVPYLLVMKNSNYIFLCLLRIIINVVMLCSLSYKVNFSCKLKQLTLQIILQYL